MSPVYNFTTALPAGDPTPHKFIVYGDMGIDALLSPGGQETANRIVEEYREHNIRHVFHNGDISYAVGFVSSPMSGSSNASTSKLFSKVFCHIVGGASIGSRRGFVN